MSTRARKNAHPARTGHDPLALAKVMPHHRAAWRIERIGWTLIALVVIAALLGAFGDGPLSRVHAGGGGVRLEYQRLQRSSAPYEYRFDIDGPLARDGRLRLRFDQHLVDQLELESVLPEPAAVVAGQDHTDFVFHVAPGSGPARITFRYRPATFGHRVGRVEVPGAPPVTLDQFIYP